jgi:PKD repeat protein
MNKIITGLSALFLTTSVVSAQTAFNPQNAREGETVEYCHQHTQLNEMRTSNPNLYSLIMQGQKQLEYETKNFNPTKANEVYIIPIVFHVLHNGGSENISKEQIYDALEVLNRDYRRLNADANNVVAAFQGIPADIEVEFRMATIAPDGTCFGGITRTQSSLTNVTSSGSGYQQLNAIFQGNDVYQGTWPHNKYLNVVIANNIGGAAGYTQYPNGGGVGSNVIFILHNYLGRIGTSSEYSSRALTHEIGHWLNLPHVWGNTNDPGVMSNCNTDDGVADTPNTIGVTSCKLNENSCGPLANVENYMDYSYCSKMFTPGQKNRMRAALNSTVGGRNNIISSANLAAVGAVDTPPLCRADFRSDLQIICPGQSIKFIDESSSAPTEWNWVFEGGTPATSTDQNPTISYSAPGIYSVSLTAKQGSTEIPVTKTAYIKVLETITELPLFEGFENYNTIADAGDKWFVESGDQYKFEVTNAASFGGAKSLKLQNYSASTGNVDNFISGTYDLTNESVNNFTFSYRFAHKKKAAANSEFLRVYFSKDCGETWSIRNPTTANLSNSEVKPLNWTPTNESDWKTVHIPFNTSAYNQFLTNSFRFKFEFTSNGGNNLFIDNINLYRGTPSDQPVLGIESIETVSGVSLYPNPTEGQVTLNFTMENAQVVTLAITDITGKVVKSTILNATLGENEVIMDNSELANGMYLIQLQSGSSTKTMQFVKK